MGVFYLHDVLDQWGPARELVGLLAHTLLAVHLLPPAKSGLEHAHTNREHYQRAQNGEQVVKNETKWRSSHVCDDRDTQVGHVGDDLAVLRRDLCMLDQLVQVLLCDS